MLGRRKNPTIAGTIHPMKNAINAITELPPWPLVFVRNFQLLQGPMLGAAQKERHEEGRLGAQ
jgi:hypothetical protein